MEERKHATKRCGAACRNICFSFLSVLVGGRSLVLLVSCRWQASSVPWRSSPMQVRHILHTKGRDIVAISEQASVAEAAHLLALRHIGAVIVHDRGGALAGILSERDLVRAIAEDGPLALTRGVGAYMTANVATCVESDTVEALMEMMTRGRFRHVPVLDDQQKLCGLISIGDVVKTRIAETVSEANSLRDYISATA
jgi:CBS domain-containing protein